MFFKTLKNPAVCLVLFARIWYAAFLKNKKILSPEKERELFLIVRLYKKRCAFKPPAYR